MARCAKPKCSLPYGALKVGLQGALGAEVAGRTSPLCPDVLLYQPSLLEPASKLPPTYPVESVVRSANDQIADLKHNGESGGRRKMGATGRATRNQHKFHNESRASKTIFTIGLG